MRIGMLSPTYPPSLHPCGVGDGSVRLWRAMRPLGAEMVVLTGHDYRGPRESGGLTFHPIAARWTPRALARVARVAREEKVHVLLVQYAPDLYPPHARWLPWLAPVMKALSPGIPTVIQMHTVGVKTLPSMAKAALLIQGVDGILSPNEEVTHHIRRFMPHCLRKTFQNVLGANVEPGCPEGPAREERRARLRRERGIAPGEMVLAHFGFYYPGKGVEQILEAAALWKARGRRFRLFMMGGRRPADGGLYPALQEMGRRLGLGEEVVWTGYLEEGAVSEILLMADLFLAPYDGGISTRRGTLMAAFAHGTPVVGTPSRIPTRYFREGKNFAAVPFRSSGALADRVEALFGDPGLRARLRTGSAALGEEFGWERIGARAHAFLLSVLRGRPLSVLDEAPRPAPSPRAAAPAATGERR